MVTELPRQKGLPGGMQGTDPGAAGPGEKIISLLTHEEGLRVWGGSREQSGHLPWGAGVSNLWSMPRPPWTLPPHRQDGHLVAPELEGEEPVVLTPGNAEHAYHSLRMQHCQLEMCLSLAWPSVTVKSSS